MQEGAPGFIVSPVLGALRALRPACERFFRRMQFGFSLVKHQFLIPVSPIFLLHVGRQSLEIHLRYFDLFTSLCRRFCQFGIVPKSSFQIPISLVTVDSLAVSTALFGFAFALGGNFLPPYILSFELLNCLQHLL